MARIMLGWAKGVENYRDALRMLGAQPESDDPAHCDALLLPGGADLHPRRYGEHICGAEGIDEARDARELALFRLFCARGRPVLGVCRGLQVINVALGGTLRQHIEGHSRLGSADRLHAVCAADDWLHALYGESFVVNSAHHQAADRLGAGLRVAALAEDGTVEALRHEALPIFAVQWHPERLLPFFPSPGAVDGSVLLADFLKRL